MNVAEYMKKHNLTDENLDAVAKPYESGDYQSEGSTVHTGSHLDAVGKRRITVIYDARDTQRVAAIAKSRGVKTSEVYRDALNYYLAAQA